MEKSKERWVRLGDVADAPADGQLQRVEVKDRQICVANVDGTLRAMDNLCPHRMGPLDEGWIENGEVVCPWHAWSFNPVTGICSNATGAVSVYPVKVEGSSYFVATENVPE
jgi:nitrite reductase (NADH) small subunit